MSEFYCLYFLLVLWVQVSHLRLESTLGLSLHMVQGGLMSFVCVCLFNNWVSTPWPISASCVCGSVSVPVPCCSDHYDRGTQCVTRWFRVMVALWLQGCQDPAYLLGSLDEKQEMLCRRAPWARGRAGRCKRVCEGTGKGGVRSWNALRSCRLPVANGGMRNTGQLSGQLRADSGTQGRIGEGQPPRLVRKTAVTQE